MNKFVLVGTQRSGTTYIRHCLNSHSDILCHGEIFFRNYPQDANYYRYVENITAGKLRNALLRKSLVTQYLDSYYAQENYKAIGYKLMYAQTRWIPYAFPSALNYVKQNDVSAIHVIRKNVLKTYLSTVIAAERKIYHAKEKQEVGKITLKIDRVLPGLNRIKAENEWWANTLTNVRSHTVTYESFVSNKNYESKCMLKFLGVDETQELTSSNIKINSDSLSDVIENIDEVAKCLSSSEFSYCLDS